jgi:hypothetical protein
MHYIALDSHKHYTLALVERPTGEQVCEGRIDHTRGSLRQFLQRFDSGSPVAVETIGNWYWIVDEIEGVSDVFGVKGRKLLAERLPLLPPHTRFSVQGLLTQLDLVIEQIKEFECRMRETFEETPELELVMNLPGVGFILGTVIILEMGEKSRFPSAGNFASYSGTVPRERSSGGKVRFGRLRPDVNHYLKWAYVEAANVISMNRRSWKGRQVCVRSMGELREGEDIRRRSVR